MDAFTSALWILKSSFIKGNLYISDLVKDIFQNTKKFDYILIKDYISHMYLPFINESPIILCPLKIVTVNFTVYILTILTCSFKVWKFIF